MCSNVPQCKGSAAATSIAASSSINAAATVGQGGNKPSPNDLVMDNNSGSEAFLMNAVPQRIAMHGKRD